MNLLIHRLLMWFAVLTGLIGLWSAWLGLRGWQGLPHGPFVYAFYGSLEAAMSFWLVGRMAEHIFWIKWRLFIKWQMSLPQILPPRDPSARIGYIENA